jgi:outer membrane lipoprotein-sorting protein
MNSGADAVILRRPLAAACALVVLIAVAPPGYAQRTGTAPGWGLQPLMAALHQVRSSTSRFVETRKVHLLNQALRSSGRLIYVAPDQLRKETAEPVPERLTVNGDHLTVERQGERTRDISLRDYSEVGALVEGIRATLAGDLPALTRYFTVTPDGGPNAWILTLTPREPRLLQLVTAIRIKGSQAVITEVETTEADGDSSDMVVSPDSK